jgi:two-component system sensor histidine kinase CreC
MRERLEGRQYVERYVHALTHELRGPLAAIRGSAELLEGPLPEADRRRFAEAVGAQTQRMSEMVDKLLALAAVEHRSRIEAPETVDLDTLVEEAIGNAAAHADAAGVALRADLQAPATVQGDAFLLRQVLGNLLDNAIDFSAGGGEVVVAVSVEGARLRIDVADRGAGIPDYALERVFERFYSLPRPAGHARSSGLGLAFVREVAQLHGGDAQLRNRDGGGAVATVWLPQD